MVTTFGLVLGAGGVVGSAYHAATLTALAEVGIDARDASLIVGTSAGSGTGAVVRAGFPPADLTNRLLGMPVSAEAAAIVERTGGPPTIPMRPRPFSRPPVPSSLGMAMRNWRHPGKVITGLLPRGTVPTGVISESIDLLYDDLPWPEDPLWVCAVRLDNGELRVFGRDDVDASIGTTVRASSAIPGFFEPVVHRGTSYVDGGLRSPTNADLLAELALAVVIIVSPMSATSGGQRAGGLSSRPIHSRRLSSEVATLRAHGVEVVTVQPTADDVAVMGRNAMDASRREPVANQALATARARFDDPRIAEILDELR